MIRGIVLKILYIHGYGGSADGSTSKIIKSVRQKDDVFSPSIPYKNPNESISVIKDYIKSFLPDAVVGSSLGAFYLWQIDCGIERVLINPALPENLKKIDNDENFISTIENMYSALDMSTKEMVYVICGNKDKVAPNYDYFKELCANNIAYSFWGVSGMDHSLSQKCAENQLNEILNRIDFDIYVFGNENQLNG